MQKFTTKTIVSLSVLVALQIVLTRFCSFSAWNVRIGFGFVALVIAAVVHGPVAAALVGGLGDMIGAIAFPTGSYFPGFTLTQVLMGLSFGLALYRKPLHVSDANAVDPHADGATDSALDAAAASVLNAALPLPVRATFAVLFNQLVLSLLMNTLWISILYGSSFTGLLTTRVMQAAVTAPIQIAVVLTLAGILRRRDIQQVLAA